MVPVFEGGYFSSIFLSPPFLIASTHWGYLINFVNLIVWSLLWGSVQSIAQLKLFLIFDTLLQFLFLITLKFGDRKIHILSPVGGLGSLLLLSKSSPLYSVKFVPSSPSTIRNCIIF